MGGRQGGLAALRNPAPGQPVTITNQMINALHAPVEAAWTELQAASHYPGTNLVLRYQVKPHPGMA